MLTTAFKVWLQHCGIYKNSINLAACHNFKWKNQKITRHLSVPEYNTCFIGNFKNIQQEIQKASSIPHGDECWCGGRLKLAAVARRLQPSEALPLVANRAKLLLQILQKNWWFQFIISFQATEITASMSKNKRIVTHDQTCRAFKNLQNSTFASSIAKLRWYIGVCAQDPE